MSAYPMEQRLSRLEGTYEQVDKRLGGVEARLGGVEARINGLQLSLEGQIAALRESQDKNLRWLTSLIVTSWLTLMATMLFRH